MKTNELRQVIITENDFVDLIYNRSLPSNIVVGTNDDAWVTQYNKYCQLFELPTISWTNESTLHQDDFIEQCLNNWHMPSKYKTFDLKAFLLDKCISQQQVDRVTMEWGEFDKRNMLPVLQFLKYFVDTLIEDNVMWGIGRGSSVASYILFLIGIHRIDSILYELDIKEFLK